MAGVCVPEVLAAATDELQLQSLTVLLVDDRSGDTSVLVLHNSSSG
jgi:hypothetical protein